MVIQHPRQKQRVTSVATMNKESDKKNGKKQIFNHILNTMVDILHAWNDSVDRCEELERPCTAPDWESTCLKSTEKRVLLLSTTKTGVCKT